MAPRAQVERVRRLKAERDQASVRQALQQIREATSGSDNLLYPIREALSVYATVGEVCDVLREQFGSYKLREVL